MVAPPSRPLKGLAIDENYQLPKELPSLAEIKKVIPPHCFQRPVSRSMYYVFKDLSICLLCLVTVLIVHQIQNSTLFLASLLLYWLAQGIMFWAVFLLGHECGHGSFSSHPLLNDTVGTVLHTLILVPYYMWKTSHQLHHSHVGHIDKETVFHPIRSHKPRRSRKPKVRGFMLGFGWFMYLIRGYYRNSRPSTHFNPYDPAFKAHVLGCSLSLGAFVLWLGVLGWFCLHVGFINIFLYYLVPIFVFGSCLVIVTFLHHVEENTPWYDDTEWSPVKAKLSSVDRDYGLIHHLTHNIGTHQIHHLFSKIPHYHMEEATVHFRKAFPELVRKCDEPIMSSFLRMCKKFEEQFIIDNDCKVLKYH